jgi:hypothetical protein
LQIAFPDGSELRIETTEEKSPIQIQIEKSATGFSKVCTGVTATLRIFADRVINAFF